MNIETNSAKPNVSSKEPEKDFVQRLLEDILTELKALNVERDKAKSRLKENNVEITENAIQRRVNSRHFPVGTWVKAKRNGDKRYVTRHSTKDCFEDDGKISGQPASSYCHYGNYEAL